jgi:hypothetical protein
VGCFFFVFHQCFCTVTIRIFRLENIPAVFFTPVWSIPFLPSSVGLYYWNVTKCMLSSGVCSLLVGFMLFHDWLELLHHHHMLSAEELDGRELGCCWMVSLVLLLVQLLPRKQLNLQALFKETDPVSSTTWPNKIVLM